MNIRLLGAAAFEGGDARRPAAREGLPCREPRHEGEAVGAQTREHNAPVRLVRRGDGRWTDAAVIGNAK